jgi:DNA-binding NarL/FixJ family response regulator
LQPSSLDAPLAGQPGAATAADLLGGEDPQIEHMLGMQAVAMHWGELPPREQKILLLVAEGKTNKEIAGEVFLSDKTVKNYVSSILSKLNLQRRAQAAAFVAKRKPGGF